MSTTIVVLGGGLLASAMGSSISQALVALGSLGRQDLDANDFAAIVVGTGQQFILPLSVVVLPLLAVSCLVGYAQIGFQMTPKAVEFNPSKLNPIQGLGRIFSTRSVVRTFTALLKIVIVTAATAGTAWSELPTITALSGSELGPVLAGVGGVLFDSCVAALIAIAALAAFDLFYQRWQHERDMRMSRKDLVEENRSSEGDPHVKARIRQAQREIAKRRMMADVPKATVVITNPTHYAVALRYERDSEGADGSTSRRAPWVVAKGVDDVAQRIKSVAQEHGIVCYEDVPLARALHAKVEIGDEIPEPFYQVVASVLAYVYRVREGKTAPMEVEA